MTIKAIAIKVSYYALSIFIFWNVLVAIRAYKFTHFKEANTQLQPAQAGLLGYLSNRISGTTYYKIPVTTTPTVPYTNVILTTSNQLTLSGWHIPVQHSKGTVIIYHGFNGNKAFMLNISTAFNELGYTTLVMDIRAHGQSQGSSCTLGMDEAEDVLLAHDYIKTTGEKNIILFGGSMGAATISHALAKYPQVQPSKVILEMPFASYTKVLKGIFRDSKYPKEPTFTLFTFWAGVFQQKWLYQNKPVEYVKSIQCPTLIQAGAMDELVPLTDVQDIYNNITAAKELVVYKDCGHEKFIDKHPNEWKKKVATFLAH